MNSSAAHGSLRTVPAPGNSLVSLGVSATTNGRWPWLSPKPFLRLDARGRLLEDPRLTPLVASHATEPLRIEADRLSISRPDAQRRLEAMLLAVSTGVTSRASALALPRTARVPLVLVVCPCDTDRPELPRHALLTIRDPEQVRVDPALLQDLFALTPAEAVVVAAVAAGRQPKTIAASLGIKPETVNAHLKKALAKTGTGRQAALVALVLRSATAMEAVGVSRPHQIEGLALPSLDHLGNARRHAA